MPNWLRLNWKFLFSGAATLAALFAAWLPYFQSPTTAIEVRLVSQSALQPIVSKDKAFGLEMTIDKVPVNDPYLSVLQIVNVGNKPVPSTDFERPLEILLDKNRAILRTEITEVNPKDLKPIIESNKELILMRPMLLNPNDSITLSVLTSGGLPTFTPSSRILGISSVTLSNIQEIKPMSSINLLIIGLMALTTTIASAAMSWRFDMGKKVTTLNRGTALLVSISATYAAMTSIGLVMSGLGFKTGWHVIYGFLLATVASAPVIIWLEKRRVINESKNQPIDG